MTIATYPDILPCFEAKPFNYKQANSIRFTEFDSGRIRTRRKAKNVPVSFSLNVVYTDDELAIFESWVHEELEDVGQFTATLRTGSTGSDNWTVQLLDTDFDKTALSGTTWDVSLQVMAKKQRYLDKFGLYGKIYGLTTTFGTDNQAALNSIWD